MTGDWERPGPARLIDGPPSIGGIPARHVQINTPSNRPTSVSPVLVPGIDGEMHLGRLSRRLTRRWRPSRRVRRRSHSGLEHGSGRGMSPSRWSRSRRREGCGGKRVFTISRGIGPGRFLPKFELNQ